MYCSSTPSSPSTLTSHPLQVQYSAFSSSPSSQQSSLLPHPLLKLMSLSATLPPPSSTSYENMLLKSGHAPPGGSPVPIPSPSSNGHPESPKSATTTPTPNGDHSSSSYSYNNNNNISAKEDDHPLIKDVDADADEVLSIGGNDEADTTTTDEVTVVDADVDMEEDETSKIICDEDDDNEDTFSQKSHISQSSSLPPHCTSSSSSSSTTGRVRKYSSEDCFSIKSLCSPASSSSTPNHNHPVCNGGVPHSPEGDVAGLLRRSSSSLIFSIANILRPDFGTSPSPFVPQKRNIKTLPPRHYMGGELYKPYNFLAGNNTSNANSLNTNPIDLSRGPANYPGFDKISSSSSSSGSKRNSNTNTNNSYQHHHKSKKSLSDGGGGSSGDRLKAGRKESTHLLKNNVNHLKSTNGVSSGGNNSVSKPVTSLPNPKSGGGGGGGGSDSGKGQNLWPAWVYCTRYSDRPSSGPRAKRERKSKEKEVDEKRPRTAFTAEQLSRLKKEFDENRYLTEKRRQDLARELRLHENQIKIWFQNKRAKLKKASGTRGGLALQLMAQGLYNHSTLKSGPEDEDSDE